ncbi:MAG: hypothetical protein CMC74_02765 [Flavobacteriaceae bacterium]|nr:hypothetical protein [Flavobacteriaceae bacterium]|tara:strand:- start:5305 stop:6093 length:789 start_codon:yes stop_codon:yes gene_type:complete
MVIPKAVLKKRKELAKDISNFLQIISIELPNSNFSGIQSAISDLYNAKYIPQVYDKPTDPDIWGYDAPDVLFRFPKMPEKSKPHPLKSVELLFTIQIRGKTEHLQTFNDPLESLAFDVIIKAEHNEKKMLTSYHLDRHTYKVGDNESLEAHPCYHFQFGGKKMIDEHGKEIDTGGILFLNPPRISHYPMDLILGIDFLLSNFLPLNWRNLAQHNDEYNAIVEKYQGLFLKPYAINFASHWDRRVLNGSQINWNPISICPQII